MSTQIRLVTKVHKNQGRSSTYTNTREILFNIFFRFAYDEDQLLMQKLSNDKATVLNKFDERGALLQSIGPLGTDLSLTPRFNNGCRKIG